MCLQFLLYRSAQPSMSSYCRPSIPSTVPAARRAGPRDGSGPPCSRWVPLRANRPTESTSKGPFIVPCAQSYSIVTESPATLIRTCSPPQVPSRIRRIGRAAPNEANTLAERKQRARIDRPLWFGVLNPQLLISDLAGSLLHLS